MADESEDGGRLGRQWKTFEDLEDVEESEDGGRRGKTFGDLEDV
jgi:hypothetical protein